MAPRSWKISVLSLAAGWLLLVDPQWMQGAPAGPVGQWQSYGGFDTQQICESFRMQFIAEQKQIDQDLLRKHSACMPDNAGTPRTSD